MAGDDINRAIGRLEGKMDEALKQMKQMNKGQGQMWGEINGIKIELATLKTQKVGWSQLGTAVKATIVALSALVGLMMAINSLKSMFITSQVFIPHIFYVFIPHIIQLLSGGA